MKKMSLLFPKRPQIFTSHETDLFLKLFSNSPEHWVSEKKDLKEFLYVCILQDAPLHRAMFLDETKFCEQLLKRVIKETFL